MSKRQQFALLCGCLFILALEFPVVSRQVRADWAGPWGKPMEAAPGQMSVLSSRDGPVGAQRSEAVAERKLESEEPHAGSSALIAKR